MHINEISDLRPFSLSFDLNNGFCSSSKPTRRYLSQMRGMYRDEQALQALLREGDPLVYEFYELDLPQDDGNLLFGTSILYPGKVGREYYMTKGHFHTILDTAEIYYCLGGRGYLLMENPQGESYALELQPSVAVYVPGTYAHRSINTGDEPLVTFFAFRADAGHDYRSIETAGFRKLVVEDGGRTAIVDNPRWA